MQPASALPPLFPMRGGRPPTKILRIAHRGADGASKYSQPDLQRVAAQGAHLVEFDVHVTGDHHLIATHNPVLEYDGRSVWLADHPVKDLRKGLEQNHVPTVQDIIRSAKAAGLGLYADIKTLTQEAAERLATLLSAEGMTSRTILASVRSDIVARCTQVIPDIPAAVLFASTLEEPVQLAASVGARFVHPCWESQPLPERLLEGQWLERVRANGLGIICWHEERPGTLQGLADLGVDGICTDAAGLLTRVMAEARPA